MRVSQPAIRRGVTHCALSIQAARSSVSFTTQCQELVRAKMPCIQYLLVLPCQVVEVGDERQAH